jgi:glycosyltransferase involved in cell wall biosynthesis
MKLSVIIPCYNERETIRQIVAEVKKQPYNIEILIIDDGSNDGTREILREHLSDDKGVQLFFQPENKGKGAAIRRGFDEAIGDIILVQDADLEYSPNDYPVLLWPIVDGRADVVYGSRFQGGSGRVLYFVHTMGNKFLTLMSNFLTDLNLTDMETCYKVFRREVIQNLILETERFGIEHEMTAKISRIPDLRIYEVPIQYHGRTYSEGKKITWKDGVAAFWYITRFNFFFRQRKSFKIPPEQIVERLRGNPIKVSESDRQNVYPSSRIVPAG